MKKMLKFVSSFLVFGTLIASSVSASTVTEMSPSVSASAVTETSPSISASRPADPTPERLANIALNNNSRNAGWSGSLLPEQLVKNAAEIFLDPPFTTYTEGKSIIMKSSDGLRRVRFAPKTGGQTGGGVKKDYEANFEKFSVAHAWSKDDSGYRNYHVEIQR